MSYEYRLKAILLVNHILAITGLYVAGFSGWLWLTLAGWILFGKVGGEIGLHRYLAHNSFETGPLRRKILVFLSAFNCFGSPVLWCSIHRKHHVVPDMKGDPHGDQAGWKVWSTFWEPFHIERKYVVDLIRDPFIKFMHTHYLKILFGVYGVLALIDWRIPVFLISVPAVITFHSAGAVNVLCHKYGERLFDTPDRSTNNHIVNLLTLGSGLHNTHHAEPKNWTNKKRWYDLDLPGFIIKYFLIKAS